MLEVIKDKRKDVQQYLSKNKLNYRKQPEQTIKAVAEFYNRTAKLIHARQIVFMADWISDGPCHGICQEKIR